MKKQYHRKALQLSALTVGYNVLEAIASITFGILSGSSALLGFGLDSVAESLSGTIMIWRFATHRSDEVEEKKERQAYKLVAYSFFILGAYVLYEGGMQLLSRDHSQQNIAGVIIALLSILIMPFIFRLKYKLGKSIGSESLVADSKQTLACILMSVTLLLGVGLDYFFGLWWADPAAAIVIALLLLREGLEMRKEQS